MKLSDVTVPVSVDVTVNCQSHKDNCGQDTEPESIPATPVQEAIIDRLDHIVDLLTEIHHIDRLLLRNEQQSLKQEKIMTQEIQDLIAATEEQTTVQAGLDTAIQGAATIMADAVERITDLVSDLADNAGDAVAVREITAKLQRETSNMRESQSALTAATAPLAAAVQTNTGSADGNDTQPEEPAVEPPASPETEPETPTEGSI